jgi:hypothetical protein
MFLPVAGSKLSGKPVSSETMFLENLCPHWGWSSAKAGQTSPAPSNKTPISSRHDGLPIVADEWMAVSGDEDFFNNTTSHLSFMCGRDLDYSLFVIVRECRG